MTCTVRTGQPALALLRRDEVDKKEWSVYELMTYLEDTDWEHEEVLQAFKKSDERAIYKPPDGNKIWYTKRNAQQIGRWYLLSLALADQHGRAIRHFQPEGFYAALVEGREYEPPKKRIRFMYLPEHADPSMIPLEPPQAKRRRVQQREGRQGSRQRPPPGPLLAAGGDDRVVDQALVGHSLEGDDEGASGDVATASDTDSPIWSPSRASAASGPPPSARISRSSSRKGDSSSSSSSSSSSKPEGRGGGTEAAVAAAATPSASPSAGAWGVL